MKGVGCCCYCDSCCDGYGLNDVIVSIPTLTDGDYCDRCNEDGVSGNFAITNPGGVFGTGGGCSQYYMDHFDGVPLVCDDGGTYCYAPTPGCRFGTAVKDPTNDGTVVIDITGCQGYALPCELCGWINAVFVEASIYCTSDTEYTIEVVLTITGWMRLSEGDPNNTLVTNCGMMPPDPHEEIDVACNMIGIVNSFVWRKTVLRAGFDCSNIVNESIPFYEKRSQCFDGFPADPEDWICDYGGSPADAILNYTP